MQAAVSRGGFLAGVLAVLCPGLGQLYNGSLKRAVWVPGLLVVLAALLRSPITLVAGPAWIYFLYAAIIVSWVCFVVDAARGEKKDIVPGQITRIFIYLGYYFGMSILLLTALWSIRVFSPVDFYHIPANSMAPSILAGDHVVVEKMSLREVSPAAGSVILFRYPRDESVIFLKRVIATGGQKVEVKAKELFVDGRKIERRPVNDLEIIKDAGSSEDAKIYTLYSEKIGEGEHLIFSNDNTLLNFDFGPVTVPEGHLFVLGDHRDQSSDSRIWGTVAVEKVIGRPKFIYLSRNPDSGEFRSDRIGQKFQ